MSRDDGIVSLRSAHCCHRPHQHVIGNEAGLLGDNGQPPIETVKAAASPAWSCGGWLPGEWGCQPSAQSLGKGSFRDGFAIRVGRSRRSR